MKTYILLLSAVFTFLFTSCGKEGGTPDENDGLISIDYGTRAPDATSGSTRTGRTFTIVSYPETANEPDYTGSQRPVGTYCYDEEATGVQYIPSDVGSESPYGFLQRNVAKGQALLARNYRTVLVSPAHPLTNSAELGSQRVVYQRDQEVFCCPPFSMTVSGYQVFTVPDNLEMKDIRASIQLEIWRGASMEYTVQDKNAATDKVQLLNAGTYGWFHPLHGQTTVSYGQWGSLSFTSGGTEDIDITPTENTGSGVMTHSTDEIIVFAADYTSEYLIPMAFDFNLAMDGQEKPFHLNIPLVVNMDMGKRYKFKLTIKSTVVTLTYTVREWQPGYNDDGGGENVGSGDVEIPCGEWTAHDGWQLGEEDNDTIGGTTE